MQVKERPLRLFIASALLAAGAMALPRQATAVPPTKQVQKPLKTLITAIRYGKFDLAAKQLNVGEMVQRLMADDWAKLSDDEKKEMISGFERILRAPPPSRRARTCSSTSTRCSTINRATVRMAT